MIYLNFLSNICWADVQGLLSAMSEDFVYLDVSTDCRFEVLRIVMPTMTVFTFRVKTSA